MASVERVGVAPQESVAALFLRGIQRNEIIVFVALLFVAGLAWAWTVHLAQDMSAMAAMPDMAAIYATSWDVENSFLTWAMWAVMMAAMMLPSAAPVALLHHRVGAHNAAQEVQAPPTSLLIVGYILIWCLFSILATALQIALSVTLQLTATMALASERWVGVVLVVAGLYQFTSLKQRCLTLCRSPMLFLTHHYYPGARGALRMGLLHGFDCLCCCWAAMALLFVGGVMNLLWVAGLTAFVLIEKIFPYGRAVGLGVGSLLLVVGVYLLAGYSLPVVLS